jgi:hypothetical protein
MVIIKRILYIYNSKINIYRHTHRGASVCHAYGFRVLRNNIEKKGLHKPTATEKTNKIRRQREGN